MADEARIARWLRMLREGIAANFTIVCRDRQWKVDKGILCAESEYFETLCLGNFGEAAEGKVTFNEEEPEVVDKLLVFIYTNVYDDEAVLPKLDGEDSSIGVPPQVIPQKRAAEDDTTDEQQTQADRGAAAAKWVAASTLSSGTLRPLWEISPRLLQEEVTRVLRIGVLTYAFAKMMGLSELSTRASSAFMDKERFWTKADMTEVLEAVFRSTACDDEVVRLPVLTQCIENSAVVEKFPEAVQVIRKHEPAAWDFSIKFKAETVEWKQKHAVVENSWAREARCNQRNIKLNAKLREEKKALEKEETVVENDKKSFHQRILGLEDEVRKLRQKVPVLKDAKEREEKEGKGPEKEREGLEKGPEDDAAGGKGMTLGLLGIA